MKRYLEIILHSLFWVLTGYLFLKYSFIRPTIGIKFEVLSAFLIAFTIYLNYFVLFPLLFKKNHKILYLLSSLFSVGIITVIESLISTPIIYKSLFLSQELMTAYIRSIYFFIFLRDLGFLVFFVIFKFYVEALMVNKLEKEKFNIENTYLRSRIAPHFLYNVLNSIYADAILKNDKLPEYIFQLSKLLHYYVDESHQNKVKIFEEIDFYKRYIELENKRYDFTVQVDFDMDENIPNIEIAPLLFEPVVSNAFKYVQKDGSGIVKISIQMVKNNEILFSCVNTKWVDLKTSIDSTSKGLANLKSRLELLYPEKYTLTIEDLEFQYSAYLQIHIA
jgi:two-component system, LytTR family, sensor kinase